MKKIITTISALTLLAGSAVAQNSGGYTTLTNSRSKSIRKPAAPGNRIPGNNKYGNRYRNNRRWNNGGNRYRNNRRWNNGRRGYRHHRHSSLTPQQRQQIRRIRMMVRNGQISRQEARQRIRAIRGFRRGWRRNSDNSGYGRRRWNRDNDRHGYND